MRLLETVRWRGRRVSSGEVRKLVAMGDVGIAGRLLERPYAISGEIVRGHGIGSKQTVPTLNLRTDAQVLPARGVYITRTTDLDAARQWNSITNIGYRPTFGDTCGTMNAVDRDISARSSGGRDAGADSPRVSAARCAMNGSSRVPKP